MVTTDLGNEFVHAGPGAARGSRAPNEAPGGPQRPAVVDRGIQTLKKDLATRVARKGGQWRLAWANHAKNRAKKMLVLRVYMYVRPGGIAFCGAKPCKCPFRGSLRNQRGWQLSSTFLSQTARLQADPKMAETPKTLAKPVGFPSTPNPNPKKGFLRLTLKNASKLFFSKKGFTDVVRETWVLVQTCLFFVNLQPCLHSNQMF